EGSRAAGRESALIAVYSPTLRRGKNERRAEFLFINSLEQRSCAKAQMDALWRRGGQRPGLDDADHLNLFLHRENFSLVDAAEFNSGCGGRTGLYGRVAGRQYAQRPLW